MTGVPALSQVLKHDEVGVERQPEQLPDVERVALREHDAGEQRRLVEDPVGGEVHQPRAREPLAHGLLARRGAQQRRRRPREPADRLGGLRARPGQRAEPAASPPHRRAAGATCSSGSPTASSGPPRGAADRGRKRSALAEGRTETVFASISGAPRQCSAGQRREVAPAVRHQDHVRGRGDRVVERREQRVAQLLREALPQRAPTLARRPELALELVGRATVGGGQPGRHRAVAA